MKQTELRRDLGDRPGRVPFHVLLAVSFLGWSLYGLFSTAQSFIYLAARHDPRPLLQVAGTTFAMMWVWALFTPLIFLVSLRFPLRRGSLLRSALVHSGLIILVPLLDALARQVVYPVFGFDLAPILAAYLRFFDVSFFAYVSIAGLAHVFYMGGRLQREALEKSRLEADLTRAELMALKMQIQPHFLFNTLHGIAEIVHEDATQADRMITSLGELLRLTIETSGVQEVPLRQELELLEAYLAIQEMRFGERLEVEYEVSREALDGLVPNFLLQPLVENALRHGLAARVAPGRITVRARRRDGTLLIAVADNGDGLPKQHSEGLGIRNTRARLKQLYGERARFTLESAADGVGAVAVVDLPFHEDTETAALATERSG